MSKENIKDHWNLIALEYQKNRDLSFNDIEYAPGYAKESELNLLCDVAEKRVIELGSIMINIQSAQLKDFTFL